MSAPRDYTHWFVIAFWIIVLRLAIVHKFYTVPTDSVGIVQRFGQYVRTDDPGLRFKYPFGMDRVRLVPIRRQLKMEFGFSTPGATNPFQGSKEPDAEKAMVTGDLNEAQVEWIVQYRINDPTPVPLRCARPGGNDARCVGSCHARSGW